MPSTEEKPSLLSKFLAVNSKPTKETFPELPDILVWFRCALAALYGTYLGLTPARENAGVNVLLGFNFITFVPVLYCSTFLGADQESYDNKILLTGLLSSGALMLLIWTYLYTLGHEADAQMLASILSSAMVGAEESIVDGVGGEEAGTIPPVAESEF
mmetsp:Transcript_82110/g.230364  ORF Transcript_82110/g.230364 Transcript_82110/m.230364 type:complete len:158 (+) Transcript_82110:147-620(+)